jgi:hypothetical protein
MLEGVTSMGTGHINPYARTNGPTRAARLEAVVAPPSDNGVPANPPPEVLEHLNRAAEVLRDLEAARIDLHFEVGDDKQVHVQVRDSSGTVIREIPAAQAIDYMTGQDRSLLVDVTG